MSAIIPFSISLSRRNAVVIDGARGIGYAICDRLAEASADVDRNPVS